MRLLILLSVILSAIPGPVGVYMMVLVAGPLLTYLLVSFAWRALNNVEQLQQDSQRAMIEINERQRSAK
jgi:hypothetical protein